MKEIENKLNDIQEKLILEIKKFKDEIMEKNEILTEKINIIKEDIKRINKTIKYLSSDKKNNYVNTLTNKVREENWQLKSFINKEINFASEYVRKSELEKKLGKLVLINEKMIEKKIMEYVEGDKIDWAYKHSGGNIIAVKNVYSRIKDILLAKWSTLMIDVIKGPERCYLFKKEGGSVLISLSKKIILKGFTYQSIYSKTNPNKESVPKEIKVYRIYKDKNILLKSKTNDEIFIYDIDGKPAQYFEFEKVSEEVNRVKFEFVSNYGHENFTCVYRLKVHGE